MKKKNREFTVFSLSALDLFCSAMGVFMILCIIVFPYYMKEEPKPEPTPPTETPPEPTPEPDNKYKFTPNLTLLLSWEAQVKVEGSSQEPFWEPILFHDVDMEIAVLKPDGTPVLANGDPIRYHTRNKTINGRPDIFLNDSSKGGADVWMTPKAEPGKFAVYYKLQEFESGFSEVLELSDKAKPDEMQTYRILGFRIVLTAITPEGKKVAEPLEFTYHDFKNLTGKSPEHMLDVIVKDDGSISFSTDN